MRGKLICLEGMDFTGKSTHMRHICHFLRQRGRRVIRTREPGGTRVATKLRRLLKTEATEEILPQTELWLFFAARCQHIHHVIVPHLARGDWVVTDRFILSSYAYQGGGRGLNSKHIDALVAALPPLRPDLTLIFDIPPAVARLRASQGKPDRIEQEGERFFRRVRTVYRSYARQHADCALIDATRPETQVRAEIAQHLAAL